MAGAESNFVLYLHYRVLTGRRLFGGMGVMCSVL